MNAPSGALGVDQLLDRARASLVRVHPRDAYDELLVGAAVAVDIRPAEQRVVEGELHPCLHPLVIERNVLEWRLDPGCSARLPLASYDLRVLVLCQEGYTSSLAAAALQELGVRRASDIIGGFRSWREAGLPVAA